MSIIAVGAYLYGALYLIGVFALAVAEGNRHAAIAAIASAGISYLTQMLVGLEAADLIKPAWSTITCVIAILASIAAGVLLIVGA